VVIGPPNPVSPAGGIRTTTRRPALLASNAPTSGPHGQLIYIFEVSLDSAFSSRVVLEQAEAGSSQTALAIPHDLAVNTLHFWRARVTNGEVTGSWSKTESFLTPLAVVAPPPGGGGGGGGTGGGGSCASSDGNSIVNCIMGKYPSYLAVGVSTNQREANSTYRCRSFSSLPWAPGARSRRVVWSSAVRRCCRSSNRTPANVTCA
jgi:hypothetical protein